MKKPINLSVMNKHKRLIINALYAVTILIMFLGLYFSFFSIINNISIKVLSSSIHGVVFGSMVFYLGIRNFLSVNKLQIELNKNTSQFSWLNFKKEKQNKV